MGHFWDFMASYGGPAIGALIGLVIVVYLLGWLYQLGKIFTVELYRAVRYDRHGVCYKCKQPYARTYGITADQTYGPDMVTQSVCSCGGASIVHGNRRFADWAGF